MNTTFLMIMAALVAVPFVLLVSLLGMLLAAFFIKVVALTWVALEVVQRWGRRRRR